MLAHEERVAEEADAGKAANVWVVGSSHKIYSISIMEKDSGFFRHHALFNRHLARHSGEDAGKAFRSVEDSAPTWHYGYHSRDRLMRGRDYNMRGGKVSRMLGPSAKELR